MVMIVVRRIGDWLVRIFGTYAYGIIAGTSRVQYA